MCACAVCCQVSMQGIRYTGIDIIDRSKHEFPASADPGTVSAHIAHTYT